MNGPWIVGFHAVLAVLESEPPGRVAVAPGRPPDAVSASSKALPEPVAWLCEGFRKRRLDEVALGYPHNGCALRSAPVGLRDIDDLIRPDGEPAACAPRRPRRSSQPRCGGADGGSLRHRRRHHCRPIGATARRGDRQGGGGPSRRVPLVRVNVAADALRTLRDAGYWTLGAAMEADTESRDRPTAAMGPLHWCPSTRVCEQRPDRHRRVCCHPHGRGRREPQSLRGGRGFDV